MAVSTSPITCSAADLALMLDLTDRRIRQLADEGIIRRAARGRYALIESVRSYVAYVRGVGEGDEGAPGEPNYLKERARKLRAEASLAELELMRAQRSVVEMSLMAEEVEAAFAAGRARLIGVGAQSAPRLALESSAPRCKAIVDAAVEEALHEISAGLPVLDTQAASDDPDGAEGGPGEEHAAAPASDRQPVGRRRKGPVD